jgi:hypothetical protein
MTLEGLLWILSLGGLSWACSKCTSAEVWEWVKSMALITVIFGVLFILGYSLLLAL